MLGKKTELMAVCKKFIEEQKIICSEQIEQSDHVIENAYGLIYEICEIVGYAEPE